MACCLVHGFALSPADALTLLREYNEKLSEQWTGRELAHKIDDAGKVEHRQPKGYLISAKRFFKPYSAPIAAAPPVRWPIRRVEQSAEAPTLDTAHEESKAPAL